jgi:hypothetical protein
LYEQVIGAWQTEYGGSLGTHVSPVPWQSLSRLQALLQWRNAHTSLAPPT